MANVKFTIQGDNSSAMKAFAQVKGAAGGLADNLNGSLKGALAGAFGTAAIATTIKKTIEYADNIDEASSRLDVGIEKLQEWGYAAKQSGASMEDLVNFSEKLSVLARTDPNKLTKLGINPNQTAQGLMSSVNKRVMEIGLTAEATALLKEIGGKSGGKLLNTFKTDLDEAGAQARKLGAVMSTETTIKLAALGDQFSIITQIIYSHVGPALLKLAEWAARPVTRALSGNTLSGQLATITMAYWSGEEHRGQLINKKRHELNERILDQDIEIYETNIRQGRPITEGLKLPILGGTGNAITQVIGDWATEYEEAEKTFKTLMEKSAEDARNRGINIITPDTSEVEKTKTIKAIKPAKEKSEKDFPVNPLKDSNSMLSIGGLAGINAQYRIERINRDMLTTLQRIETILESQQSQLGESVFP